MDSSSSPSSVYTCALCGQSHQAVRVSRWQTASCRRCETPLARGARWGRQAGTAFTLTGIILWVPAFCLPFMTVSKFGQSQVELAGSGALALWDHGMPLLSVWTFWCVWLAPSLMLLAGAAIVLPRHQGISPPALRWLRVTIGVMRRWSMPEVYVLAVLVALIRLGAVVDVNLGAGFWSYAAMSLAILLAWRSFEFEPTELARTESAHPPETL
ncbi:paraquat-inducible protein A [Synoicihabitans lomoniglobus]|uniref:Paraquat-inducible protein A n=1 Tax=Synoicihabitans lomoniglobus TaxID=2909285 RepID=A0AAE9ZXP8_9BACT|nr:paraquat-inducible protein A [Opitutaceae bacterium LMO-M01]WED65471.1 paraquat-inducible protein A [Opitutaceae bacterium LMO-M01]